MIWEQSSHGCRKDFYQGVGNSAEPEILFCQLETEEKIFSTEKLIGKHQISIFRKDAIAPWPFSMLMTAAL